MSSVKCYVCKYVLCFAFRFHSRVGLAGHLVLAHEIFTSFFGTIHHNDLSREL